MGEHEFEHNDELTAHLTESATVLAITTWMRFRAMGYERAAQVAESPLVHAARLDAAGRLRDLADDIDEGTWRDHKVTP